MSEPPGDMDPRRDGDAARLTEHLFRVEAGKLVSMLTKTFGIERLQLAEDVVQEALIRAMQTWPYYGIPANPGAWITQTAKNLAIDVIRREANFREKQARIIISLESWASVDAPEDTVHFDHELRDSRLRMMFACCHPVIPLEARVALALKTLCGFGVTEIAKAFLTTEAAIAKRLTRAKQRLRDAGIPFEIPVGDEAAERLDGVEQTLYLLFNEGYKASSGERLIREELCHEAIRLGCMLTDNPIGDRPRTHALQALMLLGAARLPARLDEQGQILRLTDQDRDLWDRRLIARGMRHFALASQGGEISAYHIQAGIAACHCTAPDFASTDWGRILGLYDLLMSLDGSPVVALNRAVALAHVKGPQAGIDAVRGIKDPERLDAYYLLHAVLGEFEVQLGHVEDAARHFLRAQQLTDVTSEKEFLAERLKACESPSAARQ